MGQILRVEGPHVERRAELTLRGAPGPAIDPGTLGAILPPFVPPSTLPPWYGRRAARALSPAALFTAFLVVFAFQLDIEEIFGLSFDWGWTLLDSGHTERVALTSKIADVDTRSIFMVPGEELEVDIDFRPESGRAYVNILGYGWVKPFGELDFLYREPVIRSPFRRTVRVPARRAGVYTVDGRILEATGTFSYDWRVRNTRPTGRLVRGARLVLFSFPGLLVLLFVIVLGVTWVGSRFD